MPELPEVETVCRGLEKDLAGLTIEKMEFSGKRLRELIPKDFAKKFVGQRVVGISRRAKFIVWKMAQGQWINHLGMSGQWRKVTEPRHHDHVIFHFSDGSRWAYNDTRRFGLITFGEKAETKWLSHLGPEPFDEDEFSVDYLAALAKKVDRTIKSVLLDQRIVVGIGNIYASEILFRAKIHPQKIARSLKRDDWQRLVDETKSVLTLAIREGGTTVRSYRDSDDKSGEFQQRLRVYDRKGEPCFTCGKSIFRKVQHGRSTFYCSRCQKR